MVQDTLLTSEQAMGRVVNRLAEIKAAKERELGQDITWEAVAKATGLAYTTVMRYAKAQVNRFDDDVLAKFCEYFNVQPGDILKYEE